MHNYPDLYPNARTPLVPRSNTPRGEYIHEPHAPRNKQIGRKLMYLYGWNYEQINGLLNGWCHRLEDCNWGLVAVKDGNLRTIPGGHDWMPAYGKWMILVSNTRHLLEEELQEYVSQGWDLDRKSVV